MSTFLAMGTRVTVLTPVLDQAEEVRLTAQVAQH